MRQSSVKATRRQLRRAMGDSGVAALAEAQQHIGSLSNSLALAHREIAAFKKEALGVHENIHRLGLQLTAVESSAARFVGQSFLDRFRWLLQGHP